MTNDGTPPKQDCIFLDLDQRHTVYSGAPYDWERQEVFASVIYMFGSGFPDASDELLARYFGGVPTCATPHCRLPVHSTVNFSLGKKLWKGVAARLEVENATNLVYSLNLGSEFNASPVSPPRIATLRVDYRF